MVAFAGFAAAAIVLTWPLALHLRDAIPGDGAGDNVTFLWNFWWMRHALATRDSFFHTNALFYPIGVDLVVHSHTALNAFLGATLLGRLTIVEAQNVIILATYALNGFATYVLAWTVTRRASASALAGFIFMASPYFAAHLHGHFNLTSAWFIPLYAAAALGALNQHRLRLAILAGVTLVAATYSDYYYVVFLIFLTVVILAIRWFAVSLQLADSHRGHDEGRERGQPARGGDSGQEVARVSPPVPRRSPRVIDWLLAIVAVIAIAGAIVIGITGGGVATIAGVTISLTSGHNLRVLFWIALIVLAWRRWRPWPQVHLVREVPQRDVVIVSVIAGVFLLGSAPVLWLAVQQWLRGDYVSHVYTWRSMPAGVDLVSLFVGNPFHPLWGSLVRRLYDARDIDLIESTAWLGIVPIVGVIAAVRAMRHDARLRFWLAILASFFIWALGPSLLVAGINTGLWLPELLIRFVPIASNARIPGRAMVIVYLALAVICAIVISRLPRERARWIAALAFAIVGIDWLAAPFPVYTLRAPHFYDEIASSASGAVLELPLGVRDGFGERGKFDHAALFYQTIHEKPIVGGFVARLSLSVRRYYEEQPVFRALLDLSSGRSVDAQAPLDRASLRGFLGEQRIRFVVINNQLAPAALQHFVRDQMPVTLTKTEGDRQLYVVE
jgi:hypothetical protein